MIAGATSLSARIRRSDLARHGVLVFGAIVISNVFTYLFYALVGRVVGVDGYGVVSALFSATLLLATAPATVAATIIVRIAADFHVRGDIGRLRRLGDIVDTASGLFAIVAIAAVLVLRTPIAWYFHLYDTSAVVAAGVVLAFSFALPLQRGVMQGTQRFRTFAISSIIESFAKAICGPLLALSFGPTGALVGLCIGSGVASLYNVLALRALHAERAEALALHFRQTLLASSKTAVAVLGINALLFYDVILVRHYFSPTIAGLYGAAALAGRAVYTVIAFVPTIVLPKASARSAAGAGTQVVLASALAAGGGIVVLSLGIVALAPTFVVTLLAGRHFAGAGPLALRYTTALGCLALANILTMFQIGMRRFAFIVPMSITVVVEIAVFVAWHPSLDAALLVLIAGHGLTLAATFYRLPFR